jgi:hypothetical protein
MDIRVEAKMMNWLIQLYCFILTRHKWSTLHRAIYLSDLRCIHVDECELCGKVKVKVTRGMSGIVKYSDDAR